MQVTPEQVTPEQVTQENEAKKEEIFEATIMSNIKRKDAYINHLQMVDGIPLFTWLDINPTELCNRKCDFCPRGDGASYPNQNLNIPLKLCQKINDELIALNYQGAVVLSGYGEPMLHPELVEMIRILGNNIHLEMVTNGDKITVELAREMFGSGLDMLVVSMYDGPHQIEYFQDIFAQAGVSSEQYTLRDRWYTIAEDYGVRLTNRGGVATGGYQPEVDLYQPCHYPFYSMMLDWNGDVMLCVHDWNKKVKMGNIALDSMLDVWKSKNFDKYRAMLKKGKRILSPCSGCNTNGTLQGGVQFEAWE
jgi:radical SAM protein with 4Fe4S-binding SPASM domain